MIIEAQKLILRMCSWEQLQALYPLPDDVEWQDETPDAPGCYKNACNHRSPNALDSLAWPMYCTLHPGHEGLHVAHDGREGICGAWTTDGSMERSK